MPHETTPSPDPATEAETRIRDALDAEPPDLDAALAAVPEAPEADGPLAEARAALEAEAGPDWPAVRSLIDRARPAPSLSKWASATPPEPVLWLAEAGQSAPLLSCGEVALLASAGGLGKSTLTIGLASAAAGDGGKAFGLGIAPGPVAMVSYEDAPVRIAQRMRWFAPWPDGQPEPQAWRDVAVIPRPGALWRADEDGGSEPGPEWPRFWRTVSERDATLAVIDPASVALADVSTSETGPVRAFMDACAEQAETTGCGVLIVAHDTKAARNEARAGGDPGAGAVAGSAAWYDAARGVLYLRREDADRLTLECLKSNYGPTGWGVLLGARRGGNGGFCGFKPEPERVFARPEDLSQWRAERKAEADAARKAAAKKAEKAKAAKPAPNGGDDGRTIL